jgi:hypothetical protein
MKSFLYFITISALFFLLSGCYEDSDLSLSENSDNLPYECYYSYEDGLLLNGDSTSMIFIKYPLSVEKVAVITFGNKLRTPNQNFDLSDIFIFNKSDSLAFYSKSDANRVFGHMTDNIQPIRINVVNQIDGDFANLTSAYFTGGCHGYKNETTSESLPTMSEVSKIVFADGNIMLPGEKRKCKNIKIIVRNLIQASNTEKKEGIGRYAMEQNIKVDFHNDTAFVKIDFTPIENIKAFQVGGLSFFNDFNNIQFIGSKSNTGIYPPNKVIRADRNVKTIRQFNDLYTFDVSVDNSYGIGDLKYNYNSYNAQITDACKSYFNLIDTPDSVPVLFKKGQTFSLKGEYVFKLKN